MQSQNDVGCVSDHKLARGEYRNTLGAIAIRGQKKYRLGGMTSRMRAELEAQRRRKRGTNLLRHMVGYVFFLWKRSKTYWAICFAACVE